MLYWVLPQSFFFLQTRKVNGTIFSPPQSRSQGTVVMATLDVSQSRLATKALLRREGGSEGILGDSASIFDPTATHLISSPYPDIVNRLDLRPLSTSDRLFAFALSALESIRLDYATAPYVESFNWPLVFRSLHQLCCQAGLEWQRQEFYVVIFRSKLREDANRERLHELDQKSHEEACASGGLLKYWFGSCDPVRRNLATCERFGLI